METPVGSNIQNRFLSEARNLKIPVTIYIVNGFQIRGTITDFDDHAITCPKRRQRATRV